MTPLARELTESERLDWLRLIRTDGIGPRTFQGLMDRHGDAGRALAAVAELARRGRAPRDVRVFSLAEAEAEMAWARKLGLRFVAICEAAYPAPLRAIDSAPPLIAVAGEATVLRRPCVAVVGSRNASAAGLVFTERLVRPLAQAGVAIVSGLARGIDAKAHEASLETGTVAVLAGGHARIYPSEHEPLARRIAERGAVISEMPLGWEPRARDFPRRNRIVAGLSLAAVVVEASRRSGSLITARFANEQGREVFAVPGSPLDARAEGTNDLLRQGASMCTGADDVLSALEANGGAGRATFGEGRSGGLGDALLWDEFDLPPETRGADLLELPRAPARDEPVAAAVLLGLIGPAPVHLDDLVRASGLPPRALQAALTELELEGKVTRGDGNTVAVALDTAPRSGSGLR